MGYSIPPPDYTMPPMTLNVAAEVGKSFGAALAQYGRIRRQERKDAEKLKQAQNAFQNEILINQQELKTDFFKTVNKAGIYDTEKEEELFDQFSKIIDTKAKAALKARMAMQFDVDLSDEDRAAYAKTVSDFKTYSSTSLTQMGGLLADINSVGQMDMVVVGNAKNGEQLVNKIALQNLSGKPAEIFGEGTIMSRKLSEEAAEKGENIITSTVKIPVSSPYFSNINSRTEGGGEAIIQSGLKSGNIKEETIDGKKYYVFKNDINISSYSQEGGMDLVQAKIPIQKSNEVLRENSFLDDKDAWNLNFVSKDPIITQELEKDTYGNKTGYQKKVKFQIIDVAKMQEDPAFQLEMSSEYGKVFDNPKVSNAQKQAYLLDIGSMIDPSVINKTDSKKAREVIVRTMTENLWGDYFKKQYQSTGKTPQNIQMQLGKEGQTLEDMEKEGGQAWQILKESRDLGIKNPLTQELYEPGQTIYLTRQESTRVLSTPSTGKSKTEAQEYFSNIAKQLGKGNTDLFTSITPTPGGKTYYKRFGDEIWEVDKDGEKKGTSATPLKLVESVYTNYSN